MKNILITSGMHAFAQRIARTFSPADSVVFGDSSALPEIMIKSGKYFNLPNATSSSFSHELLSLALDKGIDVIIPLKQNEIRQLTTCRDLFEEYGIQVTVPSIGVLSEIDFIVNPGKDFFPAVFLNGKSLSQTTAETISDKYSGVCLISDSGEEVLFCCVE